MISLRPSGCTIGNIIIDRINSTGHFFNYFRKSRAARMLDLQQYKPNLIIMHAHELHT